MGTCCSISRSPHHDHHHHSQEGDAEWHNYNEKDQLAMADDQYIKNGDGARVRFHGSSRFISMYTQQGRKGVNQDSMTVWENFNGEKDSFYCGVFDGHGPSGHEVSRMVRDNLPTKLSSLVKKTSTNYKSDRFFSNWENNFINSFEDMDEELGVESSLNAYSSGCTAVNVVKQGDNLIISNLGDSRAVLCTRDGNNHLSPVQLTTDLKPDIPEEVERIKSRKGRVFPMEEEPEVFRIWMPEEDCPGLAMTRAFGDFCLKDYGLIPTPQVTYRKITSNDEFVVLATDGVWDVLTNSEVVKIVASSRKRSLAARLLVDQATRAWRYRYPSSKVDDIAVVCMFFKERPIVHERSDNGSELNRNFAEVGPRHGRKKLKSDDGLDTVVNCEVSRTENRGLTRRRQSQQSHR